MDAQQKPTPPPEAVLIKEALKKARISGREAARRSDVSNTRWRQIISGYQTVSGSHVPVRAPAETVARMAQATGVTADQLRSAGRPDAADALVELAELAGTPNPSSLGGAEGVQVEAIASLLASLSPEGREHVLRRFQDGMPGAASPADTSDIRHRRAG
ncbi:helix-turn-helix domain-containing protein [Streptomyces sp. NPDC001750]|uniref:helix-turn-helix domain-containing protein n=1 Tax=Streptomyces sp. NPDC001750 TaxID=3364607 RepID=UPI0036B3434E